MITDPFNADKPQLRPSVPVALDRLASVAWAVEKLRVSERTVLRMVAAGKLKPWHPRRGSRERNWFLLYVDEVLELKAARDRAGRGK